MSNRVIITLSADAETVRKARQYASMHNTTDRRQVVLPLGDN